MAVKTRLYCTDGFIDDAVTIRIKAPEEDQSYTITYTFGNLQGTVAQRVSATEFSWTIPQSF